MNGRIGAAFALAALLAIGGCASGGGGPSQGALAATNAVVSVERFLQASNARDLDAMSRIFGTADGPVVEQTGGTFSCAFRRMGSWIGVSDRCRSLQDIEITMDLLATILEHEEFRVRSDSPVPGRTYPAVRVGVDLIQDGVEYTDVPFVVVQASNGRWHVEEIAVTRITGED